MENPFSTFIDEVLGCLGLGYVVLMITLYYLHYYWFLKSKTIAEGRKFKGLIYESVYFDSEPKVKANWYVKDMEASAITFFLVEKWHYTQPPELYKKRRWVAFWFNLLLFGIFGWLIIYVIATGGFNQ